MAYESETSPGIQEANYSPSEADQDTVRGVYDRLDEMIAKRQATYPEFNDRTLVTYIEDGDKRLNSYTLPRDAYDPPKEDWQSNIAMPTIKDKQMKILAGFALEPPEMEVKTYYQNKLPDVKRSDVVKWLIWGSYLNESNPNLEAFWESWEAASRGTVIKYEGYMRTKLKQKFIQSYDLETGKIEFDEREVTVDDNCFSYLMPLTELYISSYYVHDIQKQDRLAWVRNISFEQAEMEFGKNPSWKYVKSKSGLQGISNANPDTFYFKSRWETRVDENEYEVVRMYCKHADSYIVIINGVLMIDAPLLWRVNGKKVYPFAKSIWMPFVNHAFFYGQSQPDHMSGLYDQYNTLWNTMTDNQYRRMVRALLVGQVNADALNLEDEYITNSTKIIVPDVTQTKEMTVGGIDNADVTMLKIVAQAMDDAAPSMQSLMGNKQATAREVVIANDRLNELKSLYSEMIVELWRQKYALRLANIQQNYPIKRDVFNEKTGKVEKEARTYIIEGATLNAVSGEVGTLAIVFDDLSDAEQKAAADQITVDEQQMQQQGIRFKKMIVPTGYLDNTETQIMIQAASVFRKSQGYRQSLIMEKIDGLQKVFPQFFMAMSDKLIGEFVSAFGDNPAEYEQAMQQFKQSIAQQQALIAAASQPKAGAKPGAPAPAGGSESAPQGAPSNLPALPPSGGQ